MARLDMPISSPGIDCEYSALSALLDCPDDSYERQLVTLAEHLEARVPEAASALREFRRAYRLLAPDQRQELHLRTFDLAPQCVPYLSVHLFGEESFKRAELMIGFAEVYEREGLEMGRELPDHLALVLRSVPYLPGEERSELASLCLLPVLERMHKNLNRTGNPYRYILKAVDRVVRADVEREQCDA